METLPKDYFLRGHNKEYYVQEQIYKKLRFLNELPMVQNETGEFTNYIIDNDVDTIGDPITIAEGVEFNEISFGKPSAKRGATIAKGFMFKWTDKMVRQGRLNANFQIFLTKATASMTNFYDQTFLAAFSAAAGATAPTNLSDWETPLLLIVWLMKFTSAMQWKQEETVVSKQPPCSYHVQITLQDKYT